MAGWIPHKTKDETKVALDNFIESKKTLALELNGKVIGSIGLEDYCIDGFPEFDDVRGQEIGFVLNKDYWGQELTPEAVKTFIKYLFEQEHLEFITAGSFDWNKQSARVMEKCGFKYIKTIDYTNAAGRIEKELEHIMYRKD